MLFLYGAVVRPIVGAEGGDRKPVGAEKITLGGILEGVSHSHGMGHLVTLDHNLAT